MPKAIDIHAQVKCAERELNMRQENYPRWISAGKISQKKADYEISAMEAILQTLRKIEKREATKQLSMFE